jgi:hypothetical protein
MTLTNKQFAVKARELSARLVAGAGNRRLVEEFVDGYVKEFDRRGLVNQAATRRELLATIEREAFLAMLTRVHAQFPRQLTRRRPPVLKGPEIRAAEAFRHQTILALAKTFHWGPEEVEQFRRDLDLYAQMGARQPDSGNLRPAGEPPEGPFVDRTALLLDPSLMEKARRAAGKFLQDLETLAEDVLARTFSAKGK